LRPGEVLAPHEDLARTGGADRVARAGAHVGVPVVARDSLGSQEAADHVCLHRVGDDHQADAGH
jgi:hypothetical protein